MNRTQDTIILEKIFNERLELSIYKNRGQFYLTKNLRKQFRHKIEINIDVKNQKRLIIKELDEGNVQQNFYSKKLAQHISDLVGVNGNMKFLFIRDEADNCWIGVLLPEMADSYLWGINMCQKKEYLPKDYKEEIIISIYRKFWNLLEKEEIEHCYFISNCLVSGISDYRLAIYYTAMYAYTLAKQMAAIQRRCKKIESRLSLNQPLVVDGTGTLLDIYVYQSYQLENIEIKEFRDGLTLMEHIATGNWEDALIVLQEEQRKCIILVLFIIFSNAIIVFAVGYCMVYSFQKDLIEKNRRNKRKEPKKNLSRKHKYRWKNKDYQLIGWLLIIVAIVSYGAYVNWQGIQNAQKQELFLTTRIDNDTYIVVMTDGDEAILEKDRTGKDGKLKICKDKYMKVDCKNLLLEKKKYRRASGDGE